MFDDVIADFLLVVMEDILIYEWLEYLREGQLKMSNWRSIWTSIEYMTEEMWLNIDWRYH